MRVTKGKRKAFLRATHQRYANLTSPKRKRGVPNRRTPRLRLGLVPRRDQNLRGTDIPVCAGTGECAFCCTDKNVCATRKFSLDGALVRLARCRRQSNQLGFDGKSKLSVVVVLGLSRGTGSIGFSAVTTGVFSVGASTMLVGFAGGGIGVAGGVVIGPE